MTLAFFSLRSHCPMATVSREETPLLSTYSCRLHACCWLRTSIASADMYQWLIVHTPSR